MSFRGKNPPRGLYNSLMMTFYFAESKQYSLEMSVVWSCAIFMYRGVRIALGVKKKIEKLHKSWWRKKWTVIEGK